LNDFRPLTDGLPQQPGVA